MKYCYLITLTLSVFIMTGCENLTILEADEAKAMEEQNSSNVDITEQQAQIDAKKAVDEQDFRLLAFANKMISIPGIGTTKQSLKLLEKQCGFRFLSGTGDVVKIGDDLSQRKALKRYAEVYNPIVLKGCQTFQKQY